MERDLAFVFPPVEYNLTLSAGGLALLCYIFGSVLYFWIFGNALYFIFFFFFYFLDGGEILPGYGFWNLGVPKMGVELDLGG